jgi:hypothetical protein
MEASAFHALDWLFFRATVHNIAQKVIDISMGASIVAWDGYALYSCYLTLREFDQERVGRAGIAPACFFKV